MLARVFPLDTSFDAFGATYIVPEEFVSLVTPGAAVVVPWGHQTQEAIVAELVDAPRDSFGMDLKPFTSVLSEGIPWTTPEHLSVLGDIARRNFLSIHTTASLGLSADIRRRFLKKSPIPLAQKPGRPCGKESLMISADREGTLSQLALFLEKQRIFSMVSQAGGASQTQEVWAVIFPDDAMLNDFSHRFPKITSACTVVRSIDTEAVRYKAYGACAATQQPFLGTRSRLTWPLAGYDGIVMIEDALVPQLTVSRQPIWCASVVESWQKTGLSVHTIACVPRPETLYRVLSSGGKPEYSV